MAGLTELELAYAGRLDALGLEWEYRPAAERNGGRAHFRVGSVFTVLVERVEGARPALAGLHEVVNGDPDAELRAVIDAGTPDRSNFTVVWSCSVPSPCGRCDRQAHAARFVDGILRCPACGSDSTQPTSIEPYRRGAAVEARLRFYCELCDAEFGILVDTRQAMSRFVIEWVD